MRPGRLSGLALMCAAAWGAAGIDPAVAQVTQMPSPGAVTPPEVNYGQPLPEGVLQRSRPEYSPQGVIFEGLQWLPSFSTGPTYDTNIFASEKNAVGDWVFKNRPELSVQTTPGTGPWTMNADAYLQDVRYGNHGSIGHDDFGTTLNLAGDYEPTGRLYSKTSYTFVHQDPSGFAINVANAPLTSLPIQQTFTQDLTATHDVGILGLALNGGYERDNYENFTIGAASINQTQLNANAFKIGPKVSYEVSPGLRPFVAGQYLRRFYDSGIFDSNGYAFLGGSDFDIKELIRGTAYAGYDRREYDSSSIGSVSGFTYGLNLSWYPTELMTVTLSGAQNFSDTVITSTTGTPSVLNARTISGEVDYEVLRQVILSGLASYENDSYTEITRTDNIKTAGASLKYLMNRYVSIVGQYTYSNRDSNVTGFNYDRHQVGLAVTLAY